MAEESSSTLNGVKENVHIVKFVVYFHFFIHSLAIDINNSSMIQRPTPTATARVVLPNPSADNDTDEDSEVGEDGKAEEIDDGDFLADFPDNTEVRCYFG